METIFTRLTDSLVEDYEGTLFDLIEENNESPEGALQQIVFDIESELRNVTEEVLARLRLIVAS